MPLAGVATVNLEVLTVFTERLDSSEPSAAAPPLPEVAPLQESGVVGLALVDSPFFSADATPPPCLGADLERR
ncbi:uncharacterized protein G2W53_028434 [Senna tora]|uniref:Uncharacterized protein n=1 Tax=Senna tora TaxID=362788 RepID=A0A834T2Q0_9FABA|nr:uncharacterized protein G2W53_028434 [Senna tora]